MIAISPTKWCVIKISFLPHGAWPLVPDPPLDMMIFRMKVQEKKDEKYFVTKLSGTGPRVYITGKYVLGETLFFTADPVCKKKSLVCGTRQY